jgi:PTS system nitrogen regulatory IIA component
MNSAAQLLSSNDVLLDLEAPNKQALFEAIGHLWEGHDGIAASEIVASLNAREMLGSTGLGQGVAIPHARISGLKQPLAAFVRTKNSIEFDAPDGQPVGNCFMLLAPQQTTEQHLKMLADGAEMLSDAQFRERLAGSTRPEDVRQLFAAWGDNKRGRHA